MIPNRNQLDKGYNSGNHLPRVPPPRSALMSANPPEDRLTRFSDRAGDYVRFRPGYPAAALEAVLEGLGDPRTLVAADIGAGTGISSRLLGERGVRVHAIEPNEPMRVSGADEPALSGDPPIIWSAATGEATRLPNGSVDLVLCAQAFHWLDGPRALAEFRRILRASAPSGAPTRVALVWNTHDTTDPLMIEYRKIILEHATDPPTSPWFTETPCPLPTAPGWTNYRLQRFSNAQELDEAGLIGRALSASYAPKRGPGHDSMVRALRSLASRAGRTIRLAYVCEVHLSDRA